MTQSAIELDLIQKCVDSNTLLLQNWKDGDDKATNAVVYAITHAMTYHAPDRVVKLLELFEARVQGQPYIEAFKLLVFEHTGVSKCNESGNARINNERQEKAKLTWESTLEKVGELGLLNWFASLNATDKAADKPAPKTKDEKAAIKTAKALDTIAEVATGTGDDAIIAKAMLEYKQAFEKAFAYNKQSTLDQHNGTIGKLAQSMMNSISKLQPESAAA
tara:strand:+ start:916 stop:1572 length:657 start_codon:yes stop_codon:yes gene_type:complete